MLMAGLAGFPRLQLTAINHAAFEKIGCDAGKSLGLAACGEVPWMVLPGT
jgi:hypothetical protein